MSTQAQWWFGLFGSILVAVAGQAEVVPEPWRHYVSLGGIIGTAITGYMVRRPNT